MEQRTETWHLGLPMFEAQRSVGSTCLLCVDTASTISPKCRTITQTSYFNPLHSSVWFKININIFILFKYLYIYTCVCVHKYTYWSSCASVCSLAPSPESSWNHAQVWAAVWLSNGLLYLPASIAPRLPLSHLQDFDKDILQSSNELFFLWNRDSWSCFE